MKGPESINLIWMTHKTRITQSAAADTRIRGIIVAFAETLHPHRETIRNGMRELNSINLIWIILTPRISRSVAVASKAHGIGVLFAIFV
jgi:hypothetical protein